MVVLHGALEEGFHRDVVEVGVGSRVVYRGDSVTTRLQIGLADTFEVTVDEDEVLIWVEVPTKSASATFAVRPASEPHIGISMEGEAVTHRISAEPFRYA